jgi:type IV pilus assembly protein PilO
MNKIQLTNEQLGKIAGAVVFAGAFIYVYAFFFWIPTSKTIAANSAKNAVMEKDIATAKAQKASCPDLEAKLAGLKEDKEEVKQMLPGERQFPDLIKTLTDLGTKYRVSLQNITPGGSAPGEYFTKTSYGITASGDYHDLGRFLAALGLEVRIMTMENLVLSGTPGGNASASATFALVTYQYNDNTRPAAAAKPAGGKRKKGK